LETFFYLPDSDKNMRYFSGGTAQLYAIVGPGGASIKAGGTRVR